MGHYGIVYIARNDKHPQNVHKIGGSSRAVEDRMRELNSETGTFGVFAAKAYFPVRDWEAAEAKCHRELNEHRNQVGKEFFEAPYNKLLQTVEGVCKEYEPEKYSEDPATPFDEKSFHIYQVTMPNLGDGVDNATLKLWHKNEGDTVVANELLYEVETDKVLLEIPYFLSPVSGILREIIVKSGDTAKIGTTLAHIYSPLL